MKQRALAGENDQMTSFRPKLISALGRPCGIFLAAGVILCLPLLNAFAQGAKASATGSIQKGKLSFTSKNCYLCHGAQGQGLPQAGPRIGPPERSFTSFVMFVREPIGDMSPVSAKRVSDAELGDIYAYLHSIIVPAQNNASRPAGNPENGRMVLAENCAQCHGSMGQGLPQNGPKIAATPRPLSDFIQYVRMPNGDMAPISARRVSDAQLTDVYAFLQSLK